MTTHVGNECLTSESEAGSPWVGEFLGLPENIALVKVPRDFIADRFNLIGLSKNIPNAEGALKVLLDSAEGSSDHRATTLYYLIHQRYIFTKEGLEEVFERVIHGDYGVCKNIACASAKLIPLGLTDLPDVSHVKLYCHNCRAIFHPEGDLRRLDACAFGRSFPHFLVMTYKHHFEKSKYSKYVPRIFGFRVFEDDK